MVGLMIAVVITILAVSLAFPLLEMTSNAMNGVNASLLPANYTGINGMNCSHGVIGSGNFTIGTQAACVATDFTLPIFIGAVLAVAGVAMLGRILS